MRDFFRPWRTKLGVVTLVLACLFAAGWVRSCYRLDTTHTGSSNATVSLISANGSLYVYWVQPLPCTQTIWWNSEDLQLPLNQWGGFEPELQRRFAGFESGVGHHKLLVDLRLYLWIVPYWSIVIPLTLISGYYLVIIPRKSTEKKITDPPKNGRSAT